MQITKERYDYAQGRIDALLPMISENTPMDDPLMIELMIVTDIVEAYENEHYPIPVPPQRCWGYQHNSNITTSCPERKK